MTTNPRPSKSTNANTLKLPDHADALRAQYGAVIAEIYDKVETYHYYDRWCDLFDSGTLHYDRNASRHRDSGQFWTRLHSEDGTRPQRGQIRYQAPLADAEEPLEAARRARLLMLIRMRLLATSGRGVGKLPVDLCKEIHRIVNVLTTTL
jgi:hypothetical protein